MSTIKIDVSIANLGVTITVCVIIFPVEGSRSGSPVEGSITGTSLVISVDKNSLYLSCIFCKEGKHSQPYWKKTDPAPSPGIVNPSLIRDKFL